MRIGIDFGTTHTSAAFHHGERTQFIPLDRRSASPHLLRSLIYITRSQEAFLGLAAAHTFLEQDTGRPVVYEEKVVGTIENTVAQQGRGPLEPDGPITIIYDVTVEEDVGAQGRLLQSIKTGLRAGSYEGTNIFGRYYSLQELISLILSHVRTEAEATLGTEVRQATIGRPVHFADDPTADRQAEERLCEAARLAGFTQVTFVPEPVAAAYTYLKQSRRPETTLIFDFGGGTLDFTVMRSDATGAPAILATHGVGVGGDDLDSALMRRNVALHFGVDSPIDVNYDGRPLPLPEDLANLLARWQTIPLLSRPQRLAVIQRAKKYSPEGDKFAALESLVMRNHGFGLFERIEQAKRLLSEDEQTRLVMQADAINLDVAIRRAEFNLAIGDELAQARQGVREAIALAGIEKGEVDVVVRTGGSSVIPIFQQMLAREFPTARQVAADTFGSVASGLALHAHATN
ncbi:MAG: Hsp70 family protein [Caldilineaceae bacterium]|nr:Hsp70 family protein [Caldilineaceae bacterium]